MKFPNLAVGMKKLFTAEVLGLIGSVLMILGTLFGTVLAKTAEDAVITGSEAGATTWMTGAMSTLIFVTGGAVVAIIGIIFKILGINSARKDESDSNFFTIAFYCVLGCLVLSVVSGIIGSFNVSPKISQTIKIASELLSLFVTYYVLYGIEDFAKKVDDTGLAQKAKATVYLVVGAFCFSVILDMLVSFVNLNATLGLILVLIALIVEVVGYILYLSVLGRAKKTFAE